MAHEIDKRINELKQYVEKQSELILLLNHEIENNGFRPSDIQQTEIDYICEQGKQSLKEMERLEELKKQFEL